MIAERGEPLVSVSLTTLYRTHVACEAQVISTVRHYHITYNGPEPRE